MEKFGIVISTIGWEKILMAISNAYTVLLNPLACVTLIALAALVLMYSTVRLALQSQMNVCDGQRPKSRIKNKKSTLND